ncbi:MAG: sulfatase-like hydrolase/transferase [Calditrichaeota bacterium]|nr:sulfatase-like hydrolase/transferase [Calditrichota bacterium]
MNKLKYKLFIPHIVLFLLAIQFLGDTIIRSDDISNWQLDDFLTYFISLVTAFSFWLLFAWLTVSLQRIHWLMAFPGVFIVFLIETVILILCYGYFDYFNAMPNFYSWEYILEEPTDVYAILTSTLKITHFLVLTISTALLSGIWYWQIGRYRDKKFLSYSVFAALFFFLIGSAYIFINVRQIDQSSVPDVNSVAAISSIAMDQYWHNTTTTGSGLKKANRIEIPHSKAEVPANVLIIVNESLRRKNLHAFGYPVDTTPIMSNFLKTHENEVFIFQNAYANATTTMLSLTSMLTGVSTVQTSDILHQSPLVFDYAKSLNYQTFFVSAQSFAWRNFDVFFETPSLDIFWNKEIGFAPRVHDIGTDDRLMIREFKKSMQRIDKKPFLGVVHTNCNHYPYFSQQPSGSLLDRYNQSIQFLDNQFDEIIKQLLESELLDKTIIIFTSDHGEAFGEHNYFGHLRTFYEEESGIPFWIYIPQALQKYYGEKIETLRTNTKLNISNVDLVPTVIDLLKVPKIPEVIRNNFLGNSLLNPFDPNRYIFMLNNNEVSNYKIFLSLGVISGDYKYMLIKKGSAFREVTFNIRLDQDEINNLTNVHHKLVDDIQAEIRKYDSARKILELAQQNPYNK